MTLLNETGPAFQGLPADLPEKLNSVRWVTCFGSMLGFCPALAGNSDLHIV